MEGLAGLISDESCRACFLRVTFLICRYKMKGMREAPGFSVYVWVPISSVALTLLWPHGLSPTRLLCPWNSPGKNIGVDCHFLLQGIFPTQGSSKLHRLCLVHRQAGRYLTTWATWEAPGACYKALIPVLRGPPLWPNHFPKDPAPNAIISGVRIWT